MRNQSESRLTEEELFEAVEQLMESSSAETPGDDFADDSMSPQYEMTHDAIHDVLPDEADETGLGASNRDENGLDDNELPAARETFGEPRTSRRDLSPIDIEAWADPAGSPPAMLQDFAVSDDGRRGHIRSPRDNTSPITLDQAIESFETRRPAGDAPNRELRRTDRTRDRSRSHEHRPVAESSHNAAAEHFKAAALARIQNLEADLDNKNTLIQALTERLEQAAEQLDRLHRTGADRKVVSSSFGASVDRHATLTADMQRFLEQWDAMQPAVLLGQLDSRLADIRDYLSEQFEQLRGQRSFYAASGSHTSLESAVDETLQSLLDPRPTDSINDEPEGNAVLWESLKAQMLEAEAEPSRHHGHEETSSLESLVETDFVEPEVPLPFNLEDCQQHEFEAAINQRDAYISWLIRRLRAREISGGPPNWAVLENAPEELVFELRSLQTRLEEHLRLAEVELSLERARCARDLARVRQQQESAGDRRDPSASGNESTPTVATSKSAERRWRRFLGTTPKD
ncbi:MAG: hypothetical protein C0478_00045 [Planctomyces sp.]|nr:hypothetical protein [Planctomyces sp.]